MKHNKQILERVKYWRDLFAILAILGLVIIIGSIIQSKRVISPCPKDGCLVKVVRAEDIEKNTPQSAIQRSKHPEQIDHIWNKETNRGKNKNPNALHNICKAQGKSNEFGYGGMALMICFDSFEQSVQRVDKWLTERDNEALCYYNLGVKTKDCDYLK